MWTTIEILPTDALRGGDRVGSKWPCGAPKGGENGRWYAGTPIAGGNSRSGATGVGGVLAGHSSEMMMTPLSHSVSG